MNATKTRIDIKSLFIWAVRLLLPIATVFGCFVMLEYSSTSSLRQCFGMELKYTLLNLFTIGVMLSFFVIVCNRLWLASFLCSTVCGLIALVNYYVILFHGMPLSFLELKNFTAAMNVVSGYNFNIDHFSGRILLMMALMLIGCMVCRWILGKTKLKLKGALIRDGVLVLVSVAVIFFGYFGKNPIKPQRTMGWIWTEPYHKYGYMACTVESISSTFNSVTKPVGYSDKAVKNVHIENAEETENSTPDIILILNETFYDLNQITDLETDAPYMENINSMDNLKKGYAVVPIDGGGTNCSEYELLTSNSMQLMPGVTPFNVLDLAGANSIVSHLNALGYSSIGSHSEPGTNYSRNRGYPELGFQKVFFTEAFTELETLQNRVWFESDESLYRNLIRWYEQEPEDKPRFIYMLTIQNHGEWDWNEPDFDTVHAKNDFGDFDNPVDEFLSCISLSDKAFKDLTDYFSGVDRPVVVCMLGDHSPGFASGIADERYSGYEKMLRLRTVPLLIWTNYETDNEDLGTMGINYVVPTLLDVAGVELSPYYKYMLDLKKDVPVLSSFGVYCDAEGNFFEYDEETAKPFNDQVTQYFFMEYNNLQKNREQSLFTPFE